MTTVEDIFSLLKGKRLPLSTEKELQAEIESILQEAGVEFKREYRLNRWRIPDFFIDGIAIEVKIKGGRRNIYQQCVEYCDNDQVKSLILITNVSMGVPSHMNDKPVYYLPLGQAWL